MNSIGISKKHKFNNVLPKLDSGWNHRILNETGWLDSSDINYFLKYMARGLPISNIMIQTTGWLRLVVEYTHREAKRYGIENMDLVDMIDRLKNVDGTELFIQRTKALCKFSLTYLNMQSRQKIIIPYLCVEKKHHSLFLIVPIKKKGLCNKDGYMIEHYNSLGYDAYGLTSTLNALDWFLRTFLSADKVFTDRVLIGQTIQQKDSSSCGVFVCMYGFYILMGNRKKIGELNGSKKKILYFRNKIYQYIKESQKYYKHINQL